MFIENGFIHNLESHRDGMFVEITYKMFTTSKIKFLKLSNKVDIILLVEQFNL